MARTRFRILTPKQSIRRLSRSFTMVQFATALVRVCLFINELEEAAHEWPRVITAWKDLVQLNFGLGPGP